MHQDYVKTAKAKGVRPLSLYCEHIGRNAAIPIVTSIAGSLGLILGGSVIIETIFDIHGFGQFFYSAVLNRDYNVMLFSTLVGSFLGLFGLSCGRPFLYVFRSESGFARMRYEMNHLGYWQKIWKRFNASKIGRIGLFILSIFFIFALFAPIFCL